MTGQVSAECPCGLRVVALLGGDEANYATTCYAPALCETCGRVVESNVLEDEPRCPQCGAADPVPYDDPALIGEPGERVVATWDALGEGGWAFALTDGQYLCPACGQMTLRFVAGDLPAEQGPSLRRPV